MKAAALPFLSVIVCAGSACSGPDRAAAVIEPTRNWWEVEPSEATQRAAQRIVDELSFDEYRRQIESLAGFGNRRRGTPSNVAAAEWLEAELASVGYTVEFHEFVHQSEPMRDIYVTKVGSQQPDRMFIVSAHFDGLGS